MHNTLTRLQNTFGYLTSCAFFLAGLISLASLLPTAPVVPSTRLPPPPPPSANLSVRNIQVVRGRPHYYSSKREEYAHIRFDLDADLSQLFNWNTKQVFVYVSAEYPVEKGKVHQPGLREHGKTRMNKAVIWDTIIPAPASEWSLANLRQSYISSSRQYMKTAEKEKDKKKKKNGAAKASKDKVGGLKSSSSSSTTTATTDLVQPGLIHLRNQKPKYQITDPSGIISSHPNATLTLSWNVQPWVGALLWDRGMLEDKTGRSNGDVQKSWSLPFLKYQWAATGAGIGGGMVPRSEQFDFPPLKGSPQQQSTADVVKDPDGPQTPEPATVAGVV